METCTSTKLCVRLSAIVTSLNAAEIWLNNDVIINKYIVYERNLTFILYDFSVLNKSEVKLIGRTILTSCLYNFYIQSEL